MRPGVRDYLLHLPIVSQHSLVVISPIVEKSLNDTLEGGRSFPNSPPTNLAIHSKLGNSLCFTCAHPIHENERVAWSTSLGPFQHNHHPQPTVHCSTTSDGQYCPNFASFAIQRSTSEDSRKIPGVIARLPKITSLFALHRSLRLLTW